MSNSVIENSIVERLREAFEHRADSAFVITRGQYWQWLRLAKADADEHARLREDNRRLRELVKDAEWSSGFCAWCHSGSGKHHDVCDAFTPDGGVR